MSQLPNVLTAKCVNHQKYQLPNVLTSKSNNRQVPQLLNVLTAKGTDRQMSWPPKSWLLYILTSKYVDLEIVNH